MHLLIESACQKTKSISMKRGVQNIIWTVVFFFLSAAMLPAAAQKIEKDEYFLVVNSRQGLSDNCILQMMQLPDGRLAVRTRKGLDIYDGKHFVFVQLCADKMQRLPKYNGQTHLYADNQKRLWVKDYHQVYCVDLEKGKLEAPSLDWSNALYEGGQDIQRLCPIDIMPVFVKAGTILPFGPEVQYSSEKPWDELEIRVVLISATA